MWMQYIGLITVVLFGFLIKPYLLVHDEKGYSYPDFVPCFLACIKVSLLAVSLSYVFYWLIGNQTIISSLVVFVLSFLSVVTSSLVFMDTEMRKKLWNMAKEYLVRTQK